MKKLLKLFPVICIIAGFVYLGYTEKKLDRILS